MKKLLFIFCLINFSLAIAQEKENLNQANQYLVKGKFEQARSIFEKIESEELSKLTPEQRISLHLGLANINIWAKNYSKALDYVNNARLLMNNNKQLEKKFNNYNTIYGELFHALGANDLAITWYKNYLKSSRDEDGKQFIYARIGTFYFEIMDFKNATIYFKKQLESAKKKKNNYYYELSAMNNIALVHLKNSDYEIALNTFLKIEAELKKYFSDTELETAVKENIGITYFHLNKYQQSIDFLEPLIEHSKNDKNLFKLFPTIKYVGKCYLQLGMIEKAKHIEKTMIDLYQDLTTESKINLLQFEIDLYSFDKSIEKIKAFNKKLDELIALSIKEKRLTQNFTSDIVSRYLIHESLLKIRLEQKEKNANAISLSLKKKENNLLLFIIFTVVIIAFVSIFLLRQRNLNSRKKLEIDKELLLLEEEKLSRQIEIQNQNLTEFAIEIQQKSKLYSECISELKSIVKVDPVAIRSKVEELIALMRNKANVSRQLQVIDEQSGILMIEFKNRLMAISPNLSKTELELCYFIKLKLSNKEIAIFKSVNPDSVKMMKNRLKRKLNMETSDALNEFITNL